MAIADLSVKVIATSENMEVRFPGGRKKISGLVVSLCLETSYRVSGSSRILCLISLNTYNRPMECLLVSALPSRRGVCDTGKLSHLSKVT